MQLEMMMRLALALICTALQFRSVAAEEDGHIPGSSGEGLSGLGNLMGGLGGGGGGGGIDIAGMQRTLKDQGPSGLNAMLSSIAAMSAMHHNDAASLHIKKDKDGHDIYDFTTPKDPPTPAPAPPPVHHAPPSAAPPGANVASALVSPPPAAPPAAVRFDALGAPNGQAQQQPQQQQQQQQPAPITMAMPMSYQMPQQQYMMPRQQMQQYAMPQPMAMANFGYAAQQNDPLTQAVMSMQQSVDAMRGSIGNIVPSQSGGNSVDVAKSVDEAMKKYQTQNQNLTARLEAVEQKDDGLERELNANDLHIKKLEAIEKKHVLALKQMKTKNSRLRKSTAVLAVTSLPPAAEQPQAAQARAEALQVAAVNSEQVANEDDATSDASAAASIKTIRHHKGKA